MVDDRMRVAVLRAVEHIQPVDQSLAALGRKFHIDIVPRKRAAEIDVRRIVPAAASERNLGEPYIESLGRIFLHAIMRDIRVVLDKDLHRRVCKSRDLRLRKFRRSSPCFRLPRSQEHAERSPCLLRRQTSVRSGSRPLLSFAYRDQTIGSAKARFRRSKTVSVKVELQQRSLKFRICSACRRGIRSSTIPFTNGATFVYFQSSLLTRRKSVPLKIMQMLLHEFAEVPHPFRDEANFSNCFRKSCFHYGY